MLLGGVWVFREHLFPQKPDVQVGYENLDVVVQDLHLVQGGKGQRTWELEAEESRYKRHESRISFDQPMITFYNQKDAEHITARAPCGEYLQDKGLARLWPDVIATYGQTIVHAKRMVFDQKAQTISFGQDVLIEHPHVQATSDQAMLVLKNNQLVLTGNVEVDLDANSFP
jgi:LPS export ABC transporter protein LptC